MCCRSRGMFVRSFASLGMNARLHWASDCFQCHDLTEGGTLMWTGAIFTATTTIRPAVGLRAPPFNSNTDHHHHRRSQSIDLGLCYVDTRGRALRLCPFCVYVSISLSVLPLLLLRIAVFHLMAGRLKFWIADVMTFSRPRNNLERYVRW